MARSFTLPPLWDVPQIFRDRLGAQAGRQRAMFAEGHLLLVLHAPPRPDEDTRSGRLFWRRPDATWSSDQLGAGPQALHKHLAEYAEQLEALDRRAEQAGSAEDCFAVLEGLAPLQRAAANLHRTLQEARRLCPEDRQLIDWRDRAYDLERTAELLYATTRTALDYAIARRTEEQARSTQRMAVAAHRLNMLAAFFFPLVALTAIFGVNLRHGLEAAYAPYLFLGVIATGLIGGAVLLACITGGVMSAGEARRRKPP